MMDFDSFANYIIESLITKEELNAIINHLIDSYDKTGRFFQLTSSRTILSKYTKKTNKIHKALLDRAKEIIEEREKQSEYNFFDMDWPDFVDTINIDKNTEMHLIIDNMSNNILRKIERMALEKREERINHRFKVGSRICLNEYEHSEYDNLIEFFHDGGWGVANKDGVVLISNHLITKASNSHALFHPIISSYVTNQLYVSTDRDTELEGIISINPLKELLPCKYKIESMEGMRNGKYIYAFRALSKKGLWGCYNDYCKKIANFKYQTIEFNQGYVECGRNGIFHLQDHENGDGGWDSVFDGFKDLYDIDGHLILGGYTEFKYLERDGLYLFYFNTYKESYPYDVGWEGITIDKYKTCYDEAKCLILDKEFNPLLKDCNNDKFSVKGKTIDSIEEIPSTCLINGELLEVYDNHIVSKEAEFEFVEYIDDTPCYETKEMKYITYVSDNSHVKWKKAVDDYSDWGFPVLVLIDQRVGFILPNGIEISSYNAISKDFNEYGKLYAAKIVYLPDEDTQILDSNPNFLKEKSCIIQYYLINHQDDPRRIEDNWDIFNPNDVKWFPNSFLEKMGVYPNDEEYEDDDYGYDHGKGYSWSDKEIEDAYWDALENDSSNEWNID